MLTRIRNAVRVRRKDVKMPSSKLKVGIAKVLKQEGYVSGFDEIDDGRQGLLRITLKYGSRGEDVIRNLTRVSKGSCRVYKKVGELPHVLDGLGIVIVSTSKGVMSDRVCRQENVGGEMLCTIY